MKKIATFLGAFSLPMIALAQTVETILGRIAGIINILTILVVALALLAFLYGLMKYLFSLGGEKDAGKQIMIWGVVALFVMVSVWGLVRVLSNTFGVGAGGTAPIPGVVGGGVINTGGTSGVSGGINVSGGVNIPF